MFPWDIGGLSLDGTIKTEMGEGSIAAFPPDKITLRGDTTTLMVFTNLPHDGKMWLEVEYTRTYWPRSKIDCLVLTTTVTLVSTNTPALA